VSHLHYVGVLFFIGACGVGVNYFFKTGFATGWRRFLVVDALVLFLYTIWDSWAIYKRNWYFDSQQILGLKIFFSIPIEEILFFIVVPFTTVATFLALKRLTGWERERR
jgi:lycopene cyclase domain-containing protein